MKKILLDTHIFVWMIGGAEKLTKEAVRAITEAIPDRRILLSGISIWEITMLNCKKKLKFSTPIRMWIEQSLTAPGLILAPLSHEVLIESCLLPGEVHGDPADKIILATARIENAVLITRDQKMLQYARSEKMPCIKG